MISSGGHLKRNSSFGGLQSTNSSVLLFILLTGDFSRKAYRERDILDHFCVKKALLCIISRLAWSYFAAAHQRRATFFDSGTERKGTKLILSL